MLEIATTLISCNFAAQFETAYIIDHDVVPDQFEKDAILFFTQVQRRHQVHLAAHRRLGEILNFDGVEVAGVEWHRMPQGHSGAADARLFAHVRRGGVQEDVAVDVSVDGHLQPQSLSRCDEVLAAETQTAEITRGALLDLEIHHVGDAAGGADEAVDRVVVAPTESLTLLAEVARMQLRGEPRRQEQIGEVDVAALDDLVFLFARQQIGAPDAVHLEIEAVHAPEPHQS